MPFFGTEGQMSLHKEGEVVCINGVSGAMREGRFRYDTMRVRGRRGHDTVILGWARFDSSDTNRLLRRISDSTPWFRDGLNGAGQIMLLRSMRHRARHPNR